MSLLDSIRLIGCCGAYCKTCKPLLEGFCKGCKLGYERGERDINRAKCKMKVCCLKERKLETCADCTDYPSCPTIRDFHDKKPFKYKKYKQSIEFIRKYSYTRFIKQADVWKDAYGKLDDANSRDDI